MVEEPFDTLDIHSESRTYGFTLMQPLFPTPSQEVRLGVTGEYRTAKTTFDDNCFDFFETGKCKKTSISVVRLFGQWTLATPRNVVAARSTLSVGMHALGSTKRSGGLPDSEFLTWLGQAQWAHRLFDGNELLMRLDVQTANDALLGIEKFAVGGLRTVRGYRENQFVRDNGVVTSIELRIPLLRDARERPTLEFIPFVDYGHSWNEGLQTGQTIASVGAGVRISPWPWLRGELYWGARLKKAPEPGDDIQNHGISFALTLEAF